MPRRTRATGFTFVEILIIAVLLSVTMVAYLALTGRETRWTRDVEDGSTALLLAGNVLAYYDNASLAELRPGGAAPPADADEAFPYDTVGVTHLAMASPFFMESALGSAACGEALRPWVERRQPRFDLWYTHRPRPAPGDEPVEYDVGRLRCVVTWSDDRGMERRTELTKVYRP